MFEFIMTLLVGLLSGAVIILLLAHIIDSRNDREVKRRAKMVAAYMDEYGVDVNEAYLTLQKLDFVY